MTQQRLDAGRFYGEVMGKRHCNGVILSEIYHKRARRMPSHAHELAYFSLLLNGGYREYFGRRETVYRPMTIMYHPPDFEHRDEIADGGGRFFSVEIRSAWLDRLREYTGSCQISSELHSGELVWTATRLYREHKEFDACSGLAVEGLLLEMLAVASRISALKEYDGAPLWLGRVIDLLQAEFQENLTLDYLSSVVGVNPFHLSRVFRKFQHETIAEYVNKLRVRYCCQKLAEHDVPLSRIALDAGFADQSHFTRIFKRVTGLTPKIFRSLIPRA